MLVSPPQAFLRETYFLHPSLAMVVAQHDGAIEQGEADPQAVGRDQRQDCPEEHALEQVVERAEQQAPPGDANCRGQLSRDR